MVAAANANADRQLESAQSRPWEMLFVPILGLVSWDKGRSAHLEEHELICKRVVKERFDVAM